MRTDVAYVQLTYSDPRHPGPVLTTSEGFQGICRTDGYTLAYDGTIYRLRAEEPAVRGLPPQELARLLLERYRLAGTSALTTIVGDFVLIILGPHDTLCYRSLTASVQLYIGQHTISTRLLPVAASQPSVRLDPEYLVRFLLQTPSLQHGLSYTPIIGITRLGPGHLLRLSDDGRPDERPLASCRYDFRTVAHTPLAETAAHLRTILTEVVADRLPLDHSTPITCELSGGLDSSVITALVSQQRPAVRAVMFSYPDKPSHQVCEQAARTVAQTYRIDLEVLPPSAISPLRIDGEFPYQDEPTAYFWYGAMFGRTLAQRVAPGSVLFSGYGSDQLFMRSPTILLQVLQAGQIAEFFSQLPSVARRMARSEASLLLQTALALLPIGLYRRLARLCAGRGTNVLTVEDVAPDRRIDEPISWIRPPDGEDWTSLSLRLKDEGTTADQALFGKTLIQDDLSYLSEPRVIMGPYLETACIRDEAPFCDPRLIDFVCREVHWRLINDWDGPSKQVLREAATGLLPDSVRLRQGDAFSFDGFLYACLRHNESAISHLLTTGPFGNHDLHGLRGLIETRTLHTEFQRLLFGATTASSQRVKQAIGYSVWWRDFEQRLAEWPRVFHGEHHDAPVLNP